MPSRLLVAGAATVSLLTPAALLVPAQAAESRSEATATVVTVAAPSQAARLLSASVSPAVAGERVTFTAKPPTSKKFKRLKASKKRSATLVLQRRDGSTWRTVAKEKLGQRSKVSFSSNVPAKAKGTVKYRVRAKVGKTSYTGGSLGLRVVAQKLAVGRSTADADLDATFTGQLTPVRAGRKVTVERYLDGAWTTVATTAAAKVDVALQVAAVRYPAWYRVRAAGHQGIPAVTSAPVRSSLTRTPTEIAHRAGALLGPEQTLGAMEAALAAGATSMEIDVQLTKDGVPIIVHGATFARTTDVAGVFPGRANDPIGSFTWDEVQRLDAGSWFGPTWAGQRIPSLEEWLKQLAGRAHLVLEVKFHPDNTGTPEQVAALRNALDAQLAGGALGDLAAAGKLTVSSFNHTFLKPFAEAHPRVPVGALTVLPPSAATLAEWSTWAEEVHAQYLLTGWTATTDIRAAGLTTSVWTLTNPADYRTALASGAERLITDRPGLLADVLAPPAPR